MKKKISMSKIITFSFFLVYFFSYIGSKSNLKLPVLILFQIYLLFCIKKEEMGKINWKYSIVFFSIFVFLLASLLLNFNISGLIKTFSLIDLLLFTHYIYPKAMREEDDYRLINIVSTILFIVLAFSFIFYYNDVDITSGRISLANNIRHLFGFGEPSIVGFLCFLEFALSFYLVNDSYKNNKKIFIFNLIKIFLSLYMVYLADIRASLISIILLVLFYCFEKLPKTKLFFTLKIMLIVITAIGSLFYIYNQNFDVKGINYILSGRITLISRGINTLIENNTIWFGEGSYRNSDVELLGKIQIDNSYIDICYQYGIITMLLFAILTILIILDIFKINKRKKICNNYDIFIKSYFICVIIYSMFEKNLFSLTSGLSLVTFCIIFAYIRKNERKQDKVREISE